MSRAVVSHRARWVRFNLVGLGGFIVQTSTLAVLVGWSGLPTRLAITLAVLAAVSHNFFWHERFTWSERRRDRRAQRWLSFNLSTGFLSVVSNVALTALVAAMSGLPVVAANVVAVLVVSVVNFFVADRLVFRG
jgi:putative flippase GtrA